MSEATILRYENSRVPRYTSYPTAPHFDASICSADYRQWLTQLDLERTVSLYLHVPFCRDLCWYCGCHTKATHRNRPVAEYMADLRHEIALVADLLPARARVAHVHWGGGTPSLITSADLAETTALLRDRFDFAPDAEMAAEFDPRLVTPAVARAWAAAGANRASLGVQTFDLEVQEAINRVQPFEIVAAAVDSLRNAGIDRINLDLVYGLPHQTVEGCRGTVTESLRLQPDRLATFGYAHLPQRLRHQRLINAEALPGSTERLRQWRAISDGLTAAGYIAIGLDHFARSDDPLAVEQAEGRLRRNFQGYTDDDGAALLAFGASAIGALPEGYVQNAPALAAYASAVREGRTPTVRGKRLSSEDRLRRAVIERLMCDLQVDLATVDGIDAYAPDCNPWMLAVDRDLLRRLVGDGVAVIDGKRIEVVEAFRPLVRTVASAFDAYLDPAQALHAVAV